MSYYGYIRERKLHPEPSAKPQITSFADVTLALLVIFLITASAAVAIIPVKLPDAEHISSRDANLAEVITVTKAGEFYYGDSEPMKGKDLWMALTAIKADRHWDVTMIRADKDTPCEHIRTLVTCLQGLGVDEICFLLEKDESGGGD